MKKELLRKFLKDECTAEELDVLFRHITRWSDQADFGPALREAWESAEGRSLPPGKLSKISSEVLRQISEKKAETRRSGGGIRPLLKYAAAIALPLALAYLGYALWWNQGPEHLVFQTGNNEKEVLVLPDESKIFLGANSTLSYDRDFLAQGARQVELQGEAYFEVEHLDDAKSLFRVQTKDLTVAVHGTVFNVNTHWDKTEVVLEEGRVTLDLRDDDREEITMSPGDLVSFSVSGASSLVRRNLEETRSRTSWKDGVLIFGDTPLLEVFQRLESIYGIEIRYGDPAIETETMTTGMPMEDLNIVIEILEKVTGYDFAFNENILTLQ